MTWVRFGPLNFDPQTLRDSLNPTETFPLSHSHLPVKHLLKQLERYRSTPRNWDIRPQWLTELIGRVSELFDPADDVARVGFECRLTEQAWELWLFLGKSEIVGGSEDGQTRYANFRFDLLTLMDNFTEVDLVEWNAQPQSANPHDGPSGSYLHIFGRIDEEPLKLMVFAVPPAEIAPGLRAHRNGTREPA